MPSDPRTPNALYDIRDNILLAQAFITTLSVDPFQISKLHFSALTRAVEIISEASRRPPEALRARHPHLPWRAIRDSGNLYRHQYNDAAETQSMSASADMLRLQE